MSLTMGSQRGSQGNINTLSKSAVQDVWIPFTHLEKSTNPFTVYDRFIVVLYPDMNTL